MQKLHQMKLLLLSTDILWEDPQANLCAYTALLDEIFDNDTDNVDIIVFPEFFTTGFSVGSNLAEEHLGKTFIWMSQVASKFNSAVLASMPVLDIGKRYNRAYFVKPDGSYVFYDKRHLFSYGKENMYFSKGDERVVTKFKDFNICLNICYDLRFPVWSRNRNLEYDVLINIANWPSTRSSVIEPISCSRAIENLSYYVFVNRSGSDAENSYNAECFVYDYLGKKVPVQKKGSNYTVVDISLEKLKQFRNNFQAWKDADNFEIFK